MHRVLLFAFSAAFLSLQAQAATVLVLQFHNNSQYSDLNWVGESVAEILMDEFGNANQIVINRTSRANALKRLSLRPDAEFTKATLLKLGQTIDADYICYGEYDVKLPAGVTELKDSSVQISAHFLDLKKMHDGPSFAEAGKLTELSRLEEHLAWESIHYVDPHSTLPVEEFLKPGKLIRLDAEESYIRGLMSTNQDQQQKWFMQAALIEPHFTGPVFELGKLALDRKKYSEALRWFERIPADDPDYLEARFKLGISTYSMGDYGSAANYFREVAKTVPLGEVFNNLGASEYQLGQPAAMDDLHRALEGDANDSTYLFNAAVVALKQNKWDEATKRLHAVLEIRPNDAEAKALLARAANRDPAPQVATTDTKADPKTGVKADAKSLPLLRLKNTFNMTAFRQLKAVLQPKSGTE